VAVAIPGAFTFSVTPAPIAPGLKKRIAIPLSIFFQSGLALLQVVG